MNIFWFYGWCDFVCVLLVVLQCASIVDDDDDDGDDGDDATHIL